jgi:hypothetical protein
MIVGWRLGGNDNVATFSATAAGGRLAGLGWRARGHFSGDPACGRRIQYAAVACLTIQDGSIASIRMPNDFAGQRERLASTGGTR